VTENFKDAHTLCKIKKRKIVLDKYYKAEVIVLYNTPILQCDDLGISHPLATDGF